MRKLLTDMYEHEAESDEDCEVYFLKPVNEYNIVDKIKEANKELFANDETTAAAAGGGGGGAANGQQQEKVTKVTFALNLEDYEPTTNTTTGGVDQKDDSSPSPPDELLKQLTQLKLKPIAEADEPLPEIVKPSKEKEKRFNQVIKEDQKQQLEEKEAVAEDEEEDEICEEILDLSEPAEEPLAPTQPPPPPPPEAIVDDDEDDDFSGVDEADLDDEPSLTLSKVTSATSSALQRRQATFDGGDDYDEGESDQKSLTNLLTESDCEEEERTLNEARLKLRQAYKSLYKTLDSKEQAKIDRLTGLQKEKPQPTVQSHHHSQHQDADEDDDLSIIVASYIPDDFELNEQSIYYKNDEEDAVQGNGAGVPPIDHAQTSTGCPKSTSKNFFNTRRFSFRRRAKPTPSISLTSASNRSSSSTNNSSALSPTIKMNYKTCCEHRHSLQEKLPRYTGYMSEYGLSAQQLQRRDQQIRRKKRFAMEQTLNRNEQELKKMQDNERAFTTWLKNKMRYPINKTRNMFDAHKRRGSVAAAAVAAAAAGGSSPSHHHHHPSSSASSRLRRRDSSHDEPVIHAYRHLLGSWNK